MSAEEALLAGLVSGEIADDDPQAMEAYAQDPDLVDRVERLRKLRGRLERAGKLERDGAQGQAPVNTDLQDRIRQQVLGHGPESASVPPATPAPAPGLWTLGRLAGVAAALALIVLGLRFALPADETPTELHLGQGQGFPLQLELVDGLLQGLSWEAADLRGGRSYTLRVFPDVGSEPLLVTGLDEARHTLEDGVQWTADSKAEVVVVDSAGAELDRGSYTGF